jgi:hypothetical protein
MFLDVFSMYPLMIISVPPKLLTKLFHSVVFCGALAFFSPGSKKAIVTV